MQTGRHQGARRPLADPLTFLGRAPGCDVRVNVEGVNPLHCLIARGPAGLVLRDLDTEHGTLVNGQPVTTCTLREGDLIAVGAFQFRVHLPAGPAEDQGNGATEAEKEALRIQAAAVVAQQAALAEAEERIRQRRGTLEQQEGQLADHLEEKRRRLVQLTEHAQAARAAVQKERAEYDRHVAKVTSDLNEAQRELLESQQKTQVERERLLDLRRRMRLRWHRHWMAERAAVGRREEQLTTDRRALEKDAAQLQLDRADLRQVQLRFNGEAEVGKRQLQADRDALAQDRVRWEVQRAREQEDLAQRERAVAQRAAALADTERRLDDEKYRWEKARGRLIREAEGLDARIRNQRRKSIDQQQEILQLEARLRGLHAAVAEPSGQPPAVGGRPAPEGSIPVTVVTVVPGTFPPGPDLPIVNSGNEQAHLAESERTIARRATALIRLAEDLADQRLLLVEQWERLARIHEGWHEERQTVQAAVEAFTRALPAEEETLAARRQAVEAAEASLRCRHQETAKLRHHLEGWSARLRIREATWESERDRLLTDVRSREQLAEKHLTALVELRRRWAKRRRQELDVVRTERGACERLRQECATLRQDLWKHSTALEEERRGLAERALALEQYRQEFAIRMGDGAAAERRVDRLRRKWVAQNANLVRATAAERQILREEIARLEDQHLTLNKQMEALAVREAHLIQRQTAWEEAQALADARQGKLQQQLQSMQAQRDRYALHLRELQDEVERIARVLLEEPDAPPRPSGQAA